MTFAGRAAASFRAALLLGVAAVAVVSAAPAQAQATAAEASQLDIPAQPLAATLTQIGRQTGSEIVFQPDEVNGRQAPAVRGQLTADQALAIALQGTGLEARRTGQGAWVIEPQGRGAANEADATDAAAAAGSYADEEVIVTAQKFEQRIQDVPMAITALSGKSLQVQKIETGADIMRAVPNLTFTKTNFTGYDISIRGIGTKAISATTDPAVSVSYNNTGLIQNRLFEQEFYDVERLEVLRGPQGTLYGRNATGGVVNVISARPKLDVFEGNLESEIGNYNSRRMVGMLNVPVVDGVLGVRVAGSMTQRDGYDFNLTTGNAVNGRDLYSVRTTIGFEPASWLRASFMWEHFEEDDNRSRTGKQLCHRDPGPEMVGNQSTDPSTYPFPNAPRGVVKRALFSQGCKPGSLYDDDAFGTVNGLSLPFIIFPIIYGGDGGPTESSLGALGLDANGHPKTFINEIDPWGGRMQSRNLRHIESIFDPIYRAKADIYQFNLEIDLGGSLTLTAQSAWNKDSVYSIQDYNRFNTDPVFVDTTTLDYGNGNSGNYHNLMPGGIFCDPQLGCSNKIVGADQSSGYGKQFSQEIRLQSHFDGPFNFSFGGNFTRYETQVDYYVFNNLLTLLAVTRPFNKAPPDGNMDYWNNCPYSGIMGGFVGVYPGHGPTTIDDPTASCPYVDPNPVESINGQGHNYFRSSNPYELKSWAVFGEAYYDLGDSLRLTAGLRYTDDRKIFTPVPSQLLLAYGFTPGGTTPKGYPAKPDIELHWGELTGRLGLDWKPDLSFTDETLVYGFYSRGYKAGGMNPPTPGFATEEDLIAMCDAETVWLDKAFCTSQRERGNFPALFLTAVDYGPTFEPEFVDAFEVGMKNTMLGGALLLNATGFYYDYKGYQVSQIKDRTAVNENFDTRMWGLELEALFVPTERLRFNANVGFMRTRVGKDQYSIDTMNRTQGDPNYVLSKPWVQNPSNCVVPLHVAEHFLASNPAMTGYWDLCGGFLNPAYSQLIDPATGEGYNVLNYPELHGGAGIKANLGGNELPNAPRITLNFGAEYEILFGPDWRATIRGDVYWQGQSWARIYNLDPYDRLKSWTNVNLSVRVQGPDDLTIEAYVKNVFDATPLTGAFLNSDDSGLTTNVFTLDPRIIGLRVSKRW